MIRGCILGYEIGLPLGLANPSRQLYHARHRIIQGVAQRCFSAEPDCKRWNPLNKKNADGLDVMRDSAIPGMCLIPRFLNSTALSQMQKKAFSLHHAIQDQAKGSAQRQAKPHLSKQHNLPSKESYLLISLKDSDESKVNAQHFEHYGEKGHQLTYFIGNQNIPSFVSDKLIASMKRLPEVHKLMSAAQTSLKTPPLLQWNLTFNSYLRHIEKPNYLAGFPFHKDIPSNGEITAIFTLLSGAELQMKKESQTSPIYSCLLEPGSLFVLSGEARWNWLHRVVPKVIFPETSEQEIYRMSLVLGCHPPLPLFNSYSQTIVNSLIAGLVDLQ